MASVLLGLALGLVLPSPLSVSRVGSHSRAARINLCDAGADDAEADVQEAAARVRKAAELFGDDQSKAAAKWVSSALESGESHADLIEKQLGLFDECLIEDEGGHCKELDAALTDLEVKLQQTQGSAWVSRQAQLERASMRVKKAAAAFGPEQAKAAEVWTAGARDEGAANPALLLHAQEYLFGECLLDYDEEDSTKFSSRCTELQDAIEALQASLGVRGRVVSVASLMADMPKPAAAANDDEGPPPPSGFSWGPSF